ncbi:hypothetical protein N8642_02540 [bacterium]|nr:hypothetical protein [bacterium]
MKTKKRKKPGPSPSLNEIKAKAILKNLESDLTLAQSCKKVGVGLSSYHRHIGSYPEIMEAIKGWLDAQKHTVKDEAIQTIRDAFRTDWKAAAWYLERRFPNEFGRRNPSEAEPQTFVVRNELGPRPRFAMDLTDDPGAKN